ncbi:MAG: hypothetical protein ACFFC0_10160 [Promethearchaeota archaeon]
MRRATLVKASSAAFAIILLTLANTQSGTAGMTLPNELSFINEKSSSLLGSLSDVDIVPRIAVVKPIFTCTAYSNAFYTFYRNNGLRPEPFITWDLNYLNVTVKDGWGWSGRLLEFLSSIEAELAGLSLGHSVALLDEIDVTRGALFNGNMRVYDVVILGFTEYVTLEEYNYYRRFVRTGGTLIIMDACNFLAEVKYYPPNSLGEPGYLSLVKGHGWEFNGTHAWKSVYHRWPEENRNWIGSNYWKWWGGKRYDYLQANTSHPISAHIRNTYSQNAMTLYYAHEENRLENRTDTEVIGYWHFIDPSEAPEDPVVAYQHRYGNGSVFHSGIMASDVIDREKFLQAFLVCAIRIGLTGEVGEWSFWQDSSFEASVELFFENGPIVPQNGCLSDSIRFDVNFNTAVIARNGEPYRLASVEVRMNPLDFFHRSQAFTVTGSAVDDYNLQWQIVVDTLNLSDTEYEFQVCCRFTSPYNSTLHVDSTLVVLVHKVMNVPAELRTALLVGTTSLCIIMVLASGTVVWLGRRPTGLS